MSSATYETVKFSCAIRGSHVYRNVWQPKENETLNVIMNQKMMTIYLR